MEKINMRDVWEKYDRGDHITDQELDEAIKQTRQAVEYIDSRGPKWNLAYQPLVNDMLDLEHYRKNRKS